jgi:hypothetical protein
MKYFTCGVALCTPDNPPGGAFPFRAVAWTMLGKLVASPGLVLTAESEYPAVLRGKEHMISG